MTSTSFLFFCSVARRSRPFASVIARGTQRAIWVGPLARADLVCVRRSLCRIWGFRLTPQFPARGFSYGLLTWLNAPRDPAVSPACCAPRWGPKQTCSNKRLTTSLLGDDLAGVTDIAPPDVGVGMGWLGQYLYIVPSTNVSITTMGSSWVLGPGAPAGFSHFFTCAIRSFGGTLGYGMLIGAFALCFCFCLFLFFGFFLGGFRVCRARPCSARSATRSPPTPSTTMATTTGTRPPRSGLRSTPPLPRPPTPPVPSPPGPGVHRPRRRWRW